MKNKRILPLMVCLMLQGGLLTACNNQQENMEDRTEQVSDLVPDDFRGMQNSDPQKTNNNTPTTVDDPYVNNQTKSSDDAGVNDLSEAPTSDRYNEKYMENPSAVRHAENSQRNNNTAGINGSDSVEAPTGYADRNVNPDQYTAPVFNNKLPNNISEAEEEAVPAYLAYKNGMMVDDLRGEATDMQKRLDSLKTNVKNAHSSPTYNPGTKKDQAGATGEIQSRIQEFTSKKAEATNKLALLQKDNKQTYANTKKILMQEKQEYLKELKSQLPTLKNNIGSTQAANQKNDFQKNYTTITKNLAQLEKLEPSPRWDSLRNQTTMLVQKYAVKFDYDYQNKLHNEHQTGKVPSQSIQ